MGWSGGTEIMSTIIEQAMKYIPFEKNRTGFYREVIKPMENADWNTEEECLGIDPCFDQLLLEKNPELAEFRPDIYKKEKG